MYVCMSVPSLVCGWCHRRHPSSSSMMRAIMSHAAHTGPPRRSCTSRGCTPPSIRRSGRPRRSVGRPRFTHHSSCPVIAVTRRVGRCRQLSTLELGGTHPPSLILRRAGRGPPRFHPLILEKASSPPHQGAADGSAARRRAEVRARWLRLASRLRARNQLSTTRSKCSTANCESRRLLEKPMAQKLGL